MATDKAKEEKTAAADKVAEGEKVSVQITAKSKIKIGAVWCGAGAYVTTSKDTADKLVKAGDAVKVY